MRLSIIIPVYNAEETVERTFRSILGQLSPDVEVIVVDDGSTDSTPKKLALLASEAGEAIHVFRQNNAGAAAARNTAIDHAQGEYLAFADADDRFCSQAVDTILKATERKADIIGWDWQNCYDGKIRCFRQADYTNAEDALKNLMGGTMKWNLWLFAVKRKLVVDNNLRFLPGADMGEDMSFILRAFSYAAKVKQIHEILYEYSASNPTSISRQLSPKRREEVSRNLYVAEKALMESPYKDLCETYLPHLKLYIKRPLLIGLSKDNYRLWYNWFPETNALAGENGALPLRTRILQGLATKKMWNAVYLYNVLYQIALRLC